MDANFSIKKYFTNQVRKLPLYGCFVNVGWDSGKLASVCIARKHKTGTITYALFLVDLFCLGIKDISCKFNQDEDDFVEHIESNPYFIKIDYDLAHNIIYAGHDFALEYEISPYLDWIFAKCILEEDTDEIPLIEIEVGVDGMPHLMVAASYDHKKALQNLKRIAGEGGYLYTIGE